MYIHSDFTNALKLLYITYVTSANPFSFPLGCGYGGQWHDGVYTSPSATGGWGNSGRTGPGAVCALMATANKAGPYPARSSLGYARVPTRRPLRSCLGRAWWGGGCFRHRRKAPVFTAQQNPSIMCQQNAHQGGGGVVVRQTLVYYCAQGIEKVNRKLSLFPILYTWRHLDVAKFKY